MATPTRRRVSTPTATTRSGARTPVVKAVAAAAALAAILLSGDGPLVQAAGQYTLSGSPDGTAGITVDDGLDVYLNGALIYTDGAAGSGVRPPIATAADIGDVLRFVVRDTFGDCTSLTTIFLTDAGGRSIVADPGFNLGCGRPATDLGAVHDVSFVIPDLAVVPRAEFVGEIRPGPLGSNPGRFAVFQDALYFSADDGVNGIELWRLGTTGAPALVADLNPGPDSSFPSQLTVAGDRLYFVATSPSLGDELWHYDGVTPPSMAADIWAGATSSFITMMTGFGNEVAFRANDGTGDELFVYGPVGGLRRFDIWLDDPSCDSAGGGCGSNPYGLTVYQGVLYFGASDEVYGTELHQYDGINVTRLTDIIGGLSPSDPQFMTGVGNRLVFSAYAGFSLPKELWAYDITTPGAPPTPLTTGFTGSFFGVQPRFFTSFNGRAYFTLDDASVGPELWTTDGTQAGTFLVKDLNQGPAGSGPRIYAGFNGELYFQATDGIVGNEMRATNGVDIRLVADLNPGPEGSGYDNPTPFGPFLVFSVDSPTPSHPWFTTGTAAGTQVVRKADGTLINPTGSSVDDAEFIAFNGALYFAATDGVRGHELWRLTLGASAPTTTTLTSSLNPSPVGDEVTFTATVTGTSPTGTVTFLDNGTPLGTVPLVSGTASLAISSLGAGSHTMTAAYSGDATNAVSTSAPLVQVVQNVVSHPTSTTLTSSPNPTLVGQLVTLTATVTGQGSPTGSVSFRDGGVDLGPPIPLVGGSASFDTASLAAGTHQLTARYNGDVTNDPSVSSPTSHVVNGVSQIVGLFSSKNPATVGDTVTFTATLNADTSGTVTFLDNGVPLGSGAVVGGQATLSISTLAIGVHPIVARYSGDAKYVPADSATLNQTVTPLNSAPTIFPIGDRTTRWGQLVDIVISAQDLENDPITFSLVNPPAGASITPGGRFTWTPSSSQIGDTVITVEASDSLLAGSASFTVTVNRHVTSAFYEQPLAAAPGPVQLEALLRDQTDGIPLEGRTILFQLGTQSTSAATDASGRARGSLVLTQPSGTVAVTASFAGDAAYEASVSAPRSFQINASPAFAPIPPPQVPWGRTLTFSYQVSDPEGDQVLVTVLNSPSGMQQNLNTLTWTPTAAQVGLTTIVLRATDGTSTTDLPVPITVLAHPTEVSALAPAAAGNGPVILRATLTDTEFGIPITGRTLSFALSSLMGDATTDAFGVARTQVTIAFAPGPIALDVSFAGDPAYSSASASRSFQVSEDTDGDALPDVWETEGVDIDGDGIIDLDLPAMGANPRRRDVFIEADWMLKPPTCIVLACFGERSLQPQGPALQMVIDAFAAASVLNPDGSTGITLHIDAGPLSIMDPPSGRTWGALSAGTLVPYEANLGAFDGTSYDWTAFDGIKEANFAQARRGVFRYVLYADTLAWNLPAGIARDLGAADFIVVAGHPAFEGGMTARQEGFVFMHEFGHTVALGHGGGDSINYKPNYTSIMNYLFGFVGVPPDGRHDFSPIEEPALDETIAGDVNGDFRLDTLFGFDDWTNLVYAGGGIGDLIAFPAPQRTPAIDPNDPKEFKRRGTFARDGDGLAVFQGPSLLVRDSGMRSLLVDALNPSLADGTYVVSMDSTLLPAALSAQVAVAANGSIRLTFPVDTAGLAPGDHEVLLTVHDPAGQILHQTRARVRVIDLSNPAIAEQARQTAAALAQVPPDSGIDPDVLAALIDMFSDTLASWQAVVAVSGRPTFSATYAIAEPLIGGTIGVIRAQSAAGAPEFLLELVRAGNLAAGRVRMRTPTGALFEAPVAGRWNATTRTFEGRWAISKQTGSITVRLNAP